jgi:hypothetical protein
VSGVAPVVTVADFRARFPEFESNSDAQIQTALDDALPWNGYAAWGQTYIKGVCTLAAHFLAVANQRARKTGGGAAATGISTFVSGRKAGALSTNYSAVGGATGDGSTPGFLALTSYGQEWYSMARIRGMGAAVLGVGDTGALPGAHVGHDELGPYRWPGV